MLLNENLFKISFFEYFLPVLFALEKHVKVKLLEIKENILDQNVFKI